MILRNFFYTVLICLFWINNAMAFELLSQNFKQGDSLPALYTCDGKEVTPQLYWQNMPGGTQSFVLIMDDPDAPMGTWDHWIVYNIPANITSLNENLTSLPPGAIQGKNSWNNENYGGPCPPPARVHRYLFKLYALNTMLPNKPGLDKQGVEQAMNGHVLATAELMAKYERSK